MNHFSVTSMQIEHLKEIALLEQLCFSQPWSEESLAILTQSNGLGVVALTSDGRLIGYGGMLTVLDEGQITNIAVHPDFRRLGVGKAILSAMMEQARQRGVNQLSLEVRASNLVAQTLYLKQGFVVAGVRKHFYCHPTEDGLVMLRQITDN